MSHKEKKNYIAPRIVGMEVDLEQGFAAGSAAGSESVRSADPQESWSRSDDDFRTIDW
ncbi:hypothetical protein [Sphingobacterium sp. UBA5996]|uniref:hypothetical protein n=1 Tax=Sphingobacterium sp. UBA5996 TaxID=1947505 RepID=UPI0025EFEFF1|nr:hypothetical protein [Sphingobacterium sp. UBA5996]